MADLEGEISKTNAALSNKINSSDLDNYYVKADVDAKDSAINNKFASYYTKEETAQQINTATVSFVTKDTDQLTNYTTTASLNSKFEAIEQNIETIEAELADHAIKADVDAEIAAVRSSIPTKSSQLENDAGYLTEHQSLDGYAKETYVDSKVEAIVVPTKVSDLENDKNYLTAVPSEYITETELNNKGYLTQHQSLDAYAKKDDVTAAVSVKADDVLFTDTYFVTKAIGDFVGDGTESLQGMTIREIFVKMLGATLKVVYDSVITQIKEEELPAYSMNEQGLMEAVPFTAQEMTVEEAKADTAGESFFYQIIDGDNVVESGYQIATTYQENDWLTISVPENVTDFHVEIYDSTAGDWTTANWKLEKTTTQTIAGYTTYSVPEMYEIASGITIRVVINNK